jgi:hypothetical protein
MILPFNPKDLLLENNKASYHFDQTGEIGGTYRGVFEFRCYLNPVQYIAADKEYRDLLGSNAALADPHADNLAYALTQLKYRILKAPPFWYSEDSLFPGGSVPDREVISHILTAATEAELQYRTSLLSKQEEAVNKLKAIIDQRKADAQVDKELEEMDAESDEPTKKPKKKGKKPASE